ncbi:MAG: hypothetical protein Q8S11_13390 [Daejeonella sp.]|uniref:hypothetical protein n=1 Tax=Daejeonella sp. TaxID=2805397 RepID=UPI0027344617|nr:hypothetical protein [Daejeonella sp.]MDP3469327.1 hypothetical protein [Daejeonella sp.]
MMEPAVLKMDNLKSHKRFIKEVGKLTYLYKTTVYSYNLTDRLLSIAKKNKVEWKDMELDLGDPFYHKNTEKSRLKTIKDLSEIIFVRIVSALEVFMIDLIRDIFIITKEPFKKNSNEIHFKHAELLSTRSLTDIYNKIINKEMRSLSSGGYKDIIKYFKQHFNIDLGNFTPGNSKMEEYHDRRHLLVHRLGRTDQLYRDKYNTKHTLISVEESYLMDCVNDFREFSTLLLNQVIYHLKNDIKSPSSKKVIESKYKIDVEVLKDINYLNSQFEFWAGDEYAVLSDILDFKKEIAENKFELLISGKERQINSYISFIHNVDIPDYVDPTKRYQFAATKIA